MGALWCLAAVLVSEIVYNMALPDDLQEDVSWYVMHGQFALAMFGSVLAYSYTHPIGKGSMVIGFIWSVTLAATDWWVPPEPRWAAAVAPLGFLLWLIYLRRKDASVSRGKETGRPVRIGSLPSHGQGGRRGSRWR